MYTADVTKSLGVDSGVYSLNTAGSLTYKLQFIEGTQTLLTKERIASASQLM